MNTDEMLEHLGPLATEALVHKQFDGHSQSQILAQLNALFPDDDNDDLAEKIFGVVRRRPGRPPAAGTKRQGRITITLPPEIIETLRSRGNVSAFIRNAIAEIL